MSDSVMNFQSFYNGPDTSAIGGALLNALVDMQAGNVAPEDAWQTGLDSAKAAIGG
jgi:cellobiose transport system substrate-binding protein